MAFTSPSQAAMKQAIHLFYLHNWLDKPVMQTHAALKSPEVHDCATQSKLVGFILTNRKGIFLEAVVKVMCIC